MAANPDRGEVILELGPHTIHCVCRRKQRRTLVRALGCEPIAFLQESRGRDEFLNQFIFHTCQVHHKGTTPNQIDEMLDDFEGDSDELVKAALYAYARGHTGEDAKKIMKVLDEAFASEEPRDENGMGPTKAVSGSPDMTMPSL